MKFFERYRARKTLSKYVPAQVAERVLSDRMTGEKICQLKSGQIDFVLVAVRGENAEIIAERMGQVVGIALGHHGMVGDLVSALVVVTFGTFPFETSDDPNRFALIEALERNLGSEIKIIHGSQPGHIGNLGNANLMLFSFIIPGFIEALGQLADLPFGATQQV